MVFNTILLASSIFLMPVVSRCCIACRWRSPDEIKIGNFIFSVVPFQDVKINIGIVQTHFAKGRNENHCMERVLVRTEEGSQSSIIARI